MAAPFLVKRRAGWYLRIRVPVGLAALFGSHLTRTLKTRDYSEARRRAVLAAARLQTCWQEAWRAMADPLLTADDLIRLDRARVHADVVRLSAAVRAQLRAQIDDAVRVDGPTAIASPSAFHRDERLLGRLDDMQQAITRLADRVVPPTTTTTAIAPAAEEASALRPESLEPWPTLIDRFFAARPGLGERAVISHRHAFREFEEQVGAKPLCALTKADVARYVEWLEGKGNTRAGRARLVRGTIVKKLQHIRSFLAWAEEKAYIAASPANGVRPRKETATERDDEERRAFIADELKQLFDSPLYTGCRDARSRAVPGKRVLKDERYWFFLAALLTGARVEELAEAPSTLVALDGIPCLDLRHSGTKTRAAPRLVPIIPELVKLGFVAWAEAKAASGADKLFQGGTASADWSKWSNRYLDDIGLDAPTATTHSLRHSFRQMLRAANIGDELMDKVFGHSHAGNATGARYGRALSPQEARLFVEHVRPPISLVHLRIGPT